MKRALIGVFLLLGIVFALSTIPLSGAIQQTAVRRGTRADVVTDADGVLILTGFNNPIWAISSNVKKYTSIASITNNSNKSILLTVTITPTLVSVAKKFWLGIRIDGIAREFGTGATTPADISLTLAPGQTVDVQGGLMNNKKKDIPVTFRLSAVSTDGAFRMVISDTARTPRKITLN